MALVDNVTKLVNSDRTVVVEVIWGAKENE